MRWGQVLLAAAIGLATAAVLFALEGYSLTVAIAAALLGYASVRLLIGTAYRSLYWLHRDDRNHSTTCRGCGRSIYRQSGDVVIRCHHTINQHPHHHKPPEDCGWVAGWPITRLFTRSMFTRQFFRSFTWQRLGAIALACLLLFTPISISAGGMLAGGPGAAAAISSSASGAGAVTATETATATATETATPYPDNSEPASTKVVERRVVERINSYRESQGRSALSRSDGLDEMAAYHSRDMIQNNYYAHKSPDGETVQDRFEQFAPQCGGGSENIHRAEIRQRMRIYGSDSMVDTTTVSGIETYFFLGWRNSEGHRENMLNSRWSQIGIGVEIEDGDAYATTVFC